VINNFAEKRPPGRGGVPKKEAEEGLVVGRWGRRSCAALGKKERGVEREATGRMLEDGAACFRGRSHLHPFFAEST
jgi:hypothetical protein